MRLSGSLEPLGGLLQLTHLDLGGWRFTGTLEPFRNLVQLLHLDISGTSDLTGDFRPLSGLTKLRKLDLGENNGFTGKSQMPLKFQPNRRHQIVCVSVRTPMIQEWKSKHPEAGAYSFEDTFPESTYTTTASAHSTSNFTHLSKAPAVAYQLPGYPGL